jgi:hypothetical protein
MTDGKRGASTEVSSQKTKARHAAPRRMYTAGAPGTRQPCRRCGRAFRTFHPARPPELGGTVIAPDTRPWQAMIRAVQTPAFGIAMMAGLILTCLRISRRHKTTPSMRWIARRRPHLRHRCTLIHLLSFPTDTGRRTSGRWMSLETTWNVTRCGILSFPSHRHPTVYQPAQTQLRRILSM